MRSRPCWARSTSTVACPAARKLIERVFRPRMIAYVRGEGERDYKTILQELASAESALGARLPDPRTRPRSPEGVHGHRVPRRQEWGSGIGRSKKEAEQRAAHGPTSACPSAPSRRSRRGVGGPRDAGSGRAGAGGSPEERGVVELPEVEVMRRDLEKDVVGRKIAEAEVRPSKNAMRVIRRHAKRKEFSDLVVGRKFTKAERRGKYVLLHMDNGDVLVTHFGMSGQFMRANKRVPLPPHTHVVLTFHQGGDLRVRRPADVRRDVRRPPPTSSARSRSSSTWRSIRSITCSRGRRSDPRSRSAADQDEAAADGPEVRERSRETSTRTRSLFAAGLRYDRPSDTLSSQEVRRLYRAMREVLREAIRFRGTTLDDEAYLDLFGKPGEFRASSRCTGGPACRAAAAGRPSRPSRSPGATRTSAHNASRSRRTARDRYTRTAPTSPMRSSARCPSPLRRSTAPDRRRDDVDLQVARARVRDRLDRRSSRS